MVLAKTDDIDADLVGEDRLFDHVAQDLRLGKPLTELVDGDITKRVESKLKWHRCCSLT